MNSPAQSVDVDVLRAQLMAPDPMQRVIALHAIEVGAEHGAEARLAAQVEAFASRGIPYYSPTDSHYQAWVGRAIGLWEKLQAGAPRVAHAK